MVPGWLPGFFTGLRFALIPPLLWLVTATGRAAEAGGETGRMRLATIAILLGIGLSDILDGWAARRRSSPPSRTGAVVDAAADRLFQWGAAAFLVFRAEPAFTPVPAWLLALLVARDAILAVGWVRARRRRERRQPPDVEHAWHGKAAMLVVFLVLLASVARAPDGWVQGGAALAAILLVWSTALHWRRLEVP